MLIPIQYIFQRIIALYPIPLDSSYDLLCIGCMNQYFQVQEIKQFGIIKYKKPFNNNNWGRIQMNRDRIFMFIVKSIFWSFDRNVVGEFDQIKIKLVHLNRFRQIEVFNPVFIFLLKLPGFVIIILRKKTNLLFCKMLFDISDKGCFT